jgi:hypothetical protein
LEKLHIRRRRRKKIPVSERQPLIRPGKANEIWTMDFVFDRIASGRTLKCLTVVKVSVPRGGIRSVPCAALDQSVIVTSISAEHTDFTIERYAERLVGSRA